MKMARMDAQRSEELRRVRAEQMRQREEIAAISVSIQKKTRQRFFVMKKKYYFSVHVKFLKLLIKF